MLTAALAATLSLDQGSLFRLFHCVWSPRHYWQAGSRHPLPTAPRRASRLLTGREGVQARGPPAELAQLGRILLRARTARLCLSLHVHCMCTACALHVHVHCMCTACAQRVHCMCPRPASSSAAGASDLPRRKRARLVVARSEERASMCAAGKRPEYHVCILPPSPTCGGGEGGGRGC